jgi:hypothetical protein
MTDLLSVGMLLYPRLTQLDLTGPHEVFTRMTNTRVDLLWKTLDLVIRIPVWRLLQRKRWIMRDLSIFCSYQAGPARSQ